jgi:hypothetical protein
MNKLDDKITEVLNKNIINNYQIPEYLEPKNILFDTKPLYSKYGIMCRKCGVIIKNKLTFHEHFKKC